MILFRYLIFVFALVDYDWFVSGSTWSQQQKLIANDGFAGDKFGTSVALDGETAVIGADLDDDKGTDSGSFYVFVRSGTTWTQQQKLVANDGAAGDYFGRSVALDGDTAVIGADYDDAKGLKSGSAYVFVRSGTTWTQQQKLVASDGEATDHFGSSVAVDDNTALIGCQWDDINGIATSGSVYVFVRSGTTWIQEQKIVANDGVAGDRFGAGVALDNDTALISTVSGSVYVFVRSGTTWTQQQKLVASDGATGDNFGYYSRSVALDGDTALIGATGDDDKGTDSGSAYVFVRSGTTWTQQQKLVAGDGFAEDKFGYSVALAGDTAVISAIFEDDKGSESGSIYLFVRSGTTWSQQQKLVASDGGAGDQFGYSVALDDNTIVIGALYDDDKGETSGSAYVFALPTFPPPPPPLPSTLLSGSARVGPSDYIQTSPITGNTCLKYTVTLADGSNSNIMAGVGTLANVNAFGAALYSDAFASVEQATDDLRSKLIIECSFSDFSSSAKCSKLASLEQSETYVGAVANKGDGGTGFSYTITACTDAEAASVSSQSSSTATLTSLLGLLSASVVAFVLV